MKYSNWTEAVFLSRPNRFIARVLIDGREETAHVKNTGRLGELLLPGAGAIVCRADDAKRKTGYDLIAVKSGSRLINIDSQAPNKVAAEYLLGLYPKGALIRGEYRRGDSRLDFYVEHGERKRCFIEVKGVTLLKDGAAMFPDAPTQRGVKHIRELISCVEDGDEAMLLFIVQLKGARCLRPNDAADPAFGRALREAAACGVRVRAVDCAVSEGMMEADAELAVEL